MPGSNRSSLVCVLFSVLIFQGTNVIGITGAATASSSGKPCFSSRVDFEVHPISFLHMQQEFHSTARTIILPFKDSNHTVRGHYLALEQSSCADMTWMYPQNVARVATRDTYSLPQQSHCRVQYKYRLSGSGVGCLDSQVLVQNPPGSPSQSDRWDNDRHCTAPTMEGGEWLLSDLEIPTEAYAIPGAQVKIGFAMACGSGGEMAVDDIQVICYCPGTQTVMPVTSISSNITTHQGTSLTSPQQPTAMATRTSNVTRRRPHVTRPSTNSVTYHSPTSLIRISTLSWRRTLPMMKTNQTTSPLEQTGASMTASSNIPVVNAASKSPPISSVSSSSNSLIIPIVSGTVGLVVLMFLIMILVYFLRKRRRKWQPKPRQPRVTFAERRSTTTSRNSDIYAPYRAVVLPRTNEDGGNGNSLPSPRWPNPTYGMCLPMLRRSNTEPNLTGMTFHVDSRSLRPQYQVGSTRSERTNIPI